MAPPPHLFEPLQQKLTLGGRELSGQFDHGSLTLRIEGGDADSRDIATRVTKLAPVGKGSTLVVLDESALTSRPVGTRSIGEMHARDLLPYSHPAYLAPYEAQKWDTLVLLAPAVCELARTRPAYFAIAVAHELAHAANATRDLCAFAYGLFLLGLPKIFPGKVPEVHQLPEELVCNEFGLFAAGELYGESQVRDDVRAVIADGDSLFRKHAESLENLMPASALTSLRGRVSSFVIGNRAAVEVAWRREVAFNISAKSKLFGCVPGVEEFGEELLGQGAT